MNQPKLEELMRHVDSKYSLAVLAAKRARQITNAHTNKEELIKPVTQALYEIAENKFNYRFSTSKFK